MPKVNNSPVYEIPHKTDKLEALYIYLEANNSEREGDAWYYLHDPNIISHLDSLDRNDAERLAQEIWTWKQELVAHLADPFLKTENPFLDGYFLYASIFLFVDNFDDGEYLMNNISIVTAISVGAQPIEFYYNVRDKVIELGQILGNDYSNPLKQIEDKIGIEKGNL